LLLAGCGGGSASTTANPAITGFEVHTSPSASAPAVAEQAAPQRRTPGCIPVRQDNADGPRNCLPKKQVCARGAVWWTKKLSAVCGPLAPVSIRIVSAPEELPVGGTMCLVWVGTPAKVREAVLVLMSVHANCSTGIAGTVAAPPADPLATTFPTTRPDCGSYFPNTRRAWPAKVTFTDPPAKTWACLIG
jgi:hypothetical protein